MGGLAEVRYIIASRPGLAGDVAPTAAAGHARHRLTELHARMILVTGGAGFIGSNFVLDWLAGTDEPVVNLDKLTYAGNVRNLDGLAGDARHWFVRGDIADQPLLESLLADYAVRAIAW